MEHTNGIRPLTATALSESLVLLVLSGTLNTPEIIRELDADSKKVHTLIHGLYSKKFVSIDVLIDLRAFSGAYSPVALESLAHLAKQDESYVRKTACFGASNDVRLAGDIVAVFAGRSNIEFFKTEEEARAWLSAS